MPFDGAWCRYEGVEIIAEPIEWGGYNLAATGRGRSWYSSVSTQDPEVGRALLEQMAERELLLEAPTYKASADLNPTGCRRLGPFQVAGMP